VAGEGDLVAGLDGGGVVPGVGGVGEDFAAEEGGDAAWLQEWDLFAIAQVGVGFVFDCGGPAVGTVR